MTYLDAVQEFKSRGYTVIILPEQEPGFGDPRDATNLGVMLASGNRQYKLGDTDYQSIVPEFEPAKDKLDELMNEGWKRDKPSPQEAFLEWLKQVYGTTVILPLWLLDHSSLTMRTGKFAEDPGNWDSGIVGYIFDTDRSREATGIDGVENVTTVLQSEVDEYSKYINGEVYSYVIEYDNEVVASVGGLLGLDVAIQEAKDQIKHLPKIQFVVLKGSKVYGPYSKRRFAKADAKRLGGRIARIQDRPTQTVQLIAPQTVSTAGQTFTVDVDTPQLESMLAEGWTPAAL